MKVWHTPQLTFLTAFKWMWENNILEMVENAIYMAFLRHFKKNNNFYSNCHCSRTHFKKITIHPVWKQSDMTIFGRMFVSLPPVQLHPFVPGHPAELSDSIELLLTDAKSYVFKLILYICWRFLCQNFIHFGLVVFL